MSLSPNRSYIKKDNSLQISKNDDMPMVEYNRSGHVAPPKVDTRAVIHDSDPFYFMMYVDVYDFCPHEVLVEVVDNGEAIVVTANHEVDYVSEKEDQIHDESRSISERFTLPPNINVDSLQWNFTPDKRQIVIIAQKNTELSVDSIQNFRNIEKREVVIEQPNDAPLVFLQSFPQPFPGHEQDQSSFARNIYANSYGYNNQFQNSNYSNYTGYNPSSANFNNAHASTYPQYYY